MDDMAKELGISKKTIYRFVEDKAQLVKLTMQNYLDNERRQIAEIVKESSNSIDEMVRLATYFFNQVGNFNPAVINDIQKYYSDTWKIYDDYRFKFMMGTISNNLNKGIQQGYYRKGLNTDVVARIYISNLDVLINQQFFPAQKYVFTDSYRVYLDYHLRGIVSPKGLEYIEQHNLFKS